MFVDQSKKLANLIGLCVFAIWLEVRIARDIGMLIDMMATALPHQPETESFGETAEFVKTESAAVPDLCVEFGDAGP